MSTTLKHRGGAGQQSNSDVSPRETRDVMDGELPSSNNHSATTSGGGTGGPNYAVPKWNRPLNLCIFLSFLTIGVVIVVLGAIFFPKPPTARHEKPFRVPMHPPLTALLPRTDLPSNAPASTVASTSRRDSSDLFFKTAWANADACDVLDPVTATLDAKTQRVSYSVEVSAARSAQLEAWIKEATQLLLSFGTRVAGSTSNGQVNAHHMITRLSTCAAARSPSPSSSSQSSLSNSQQQDNHAFNKQQSTTTTATVPLGRTTSPRPWWTVRFDNFTQDTGANIAGHRTFSNIIAEFNHPPPSGTSVAKKGGKGHIVLSAHWDSKLFNEIEFLGACDSAVPVVMILRMMRTFSAMAEAITLNERRSAGAAPDAPPPYIEELPSITVLFFDGEEAFVNWWGDDNTYGSRHLANRYEAENRIANISLLVLLDLLGPVDPQLHNYFHTQTGGAHARIRTIETQQREQGHRRTTSRANFFPNEPYGTSGQIEDDHIHWMRKGVPILHLIPSPFPPSWHNSRDNGQEIDYEKTTVDLYNIIEQFTLSFNASAAGHVAGKKLRTRK